MELLANTAPLTALVYLAVIEPLKLPSRTEVSSLLNSRTIMKFKNSIYLPWSVTSSISQLSPSTVIQEHALHALLVPGGSQHVQTGVQMELHLSNSLLHFLSFRLKSIKILCYYYQLLCWHVYHVLGRFSTTIFLITAITALLLR